MNVMPPQPISTGATERQSVMLDSPPVLETSHDDDCYLFPRLATPHALEQGQADRRQTPLRIKHVWAIRSTLQLSGRIRDLALFNLGIDSKLRGCDLVSLRVADVAPQGRAVARTTVRQKKTGRPVMFELTEHTREALDAYLRARAGTLRDICSRAAAGSSRI